MVRFNLQETLLIRQFTQTNWKSESDDQNFLEIIFIEKGSGIFNLNKDTIGYNPKDVFLITKDDTRSFDIEKETTFTIFEFTQQLFSSRMNLPDRSYWLRRIDHILRNPNIELGELLQNEDDRKLLWDIHAIVKREFEEQGQYFRHNISNMVSTILSIIARNIAEDQVERKPSKKDKLSVIDDIIAYIKQHVYEPERMRISALADTFNMTNSTLSNYFKKQTGKSLHNYILLHKLDLAKYRLENTDFTVSQIAYQLGFTDESHLTRIFKKYFNMTPRSYKEDARKVNS